MDSNELAEVVKAAAMIPGLVKLLQHTASGIGSVAGSI